MIQKKQKIHTRKIDIATYEGLGDTVVVEGILKDDRLFETYRPSGEKIASGTIHHMIIRLNVKLPQLVVEDIEVEMPTLPEKICMETLECLEPAKGMQIASGFTSNVRTMAGGPKGCNHLVTLLIAMAPAAVQGALSAMERKPYNQGLSVQDTLERFKNTCWAWRENGPLIERYTDFV